MASHEFHVENSPPRQLLYQRLIPHKLNGHLDNLDVIIIGSGVGGLSAGSALAQDGKKVVVLEQNEILGGCMHAHREGGFEFHSGVHHVGGAVDNPNSLFGACFHYCTGGRLEWHPTTNDKFDVVESMVVEGEKFDYRMCSNAHFDNVIADLVAKFPDEEEIIRRHFELVTLINRYYIPFVATKKSGLLPNLVVDGGLKAVNHFTQGYQDKTVREVMDELDPSPKLRLHLLYQYLSFGEPEDRASFAVHSFMHAHFAQGSFFPKGGPSHMALLMIDMIDKHGGKVLADAKVENLILEGSGKDMKVAGVVVKSLHTGEILHLRAPVVISDAGLENTFKTFIPESHRSEQVIKTYLDLLEDPDVTSMTSSYGTLVGFEGAPKELIPKHLTWIFPSWNQTDAHEMSMNLSKGEDFDPIVLVNFPSVRDPTYHQKFPNKDAAELLWVGKSDEFQEFKHMKSGHRGMEYEMRKQVMEQKVLDALFKQFPELKPYVKFTESFTDLTTKDHLGKRTIYNLGATQKRWKESEQGSRLDPQTPIQGLYLTGEDTFVDGIAPCSLMGLSTASLVSNKTKMKLMQTLPLWFTTY